METVWVKKNGLHWLWLAVGVVMLDQLSKIIIHFYLDYNQTVSLLPFLSFTLAYNKGAAFSFLSGQEHAIWFFIFTACLISAFLCLYLYRLRPNDNWQGISLALI